MITNILLAIWGLVDCEIVHSKKKNTSCSLGLYTTPKIKVIQYGFSSRPECNSGVVGLLLYGTFVVFGAWQLRAAVCYFKENSVAKKKEYVLGTMCGPLIFGWTIHWMHKVAVQLLPLEYKHVILLLFKVGNAVDAFVFEVIDNIKKKSQSKQMTCTPLQWRERKH